MGDRFGIPGAVGILHFVTDTRQNTFHLANSINLAVHPIRHAHSLLFRHNSCYDRRQQRT